MSRKIQSTENTHFRVLRLLEANPKMNQRELAKALGISLGKTNYCIKALLDKGMLRMWSVISSPFGRQSWDAMLGANRAVWPLPHKRFVTTQCAQI